VTGLSLRKKMGSPCAWWNCRSVRTSYDGAISPSEETRSSFAYDGDTALAVFFFLSGGKGPSPAPADFARELKEEADIDGSLVSYREKGSTIELVGKESLKGTAVYNLRITLKEGQVRNIYLNAWSFLEVRETGFFERAGKKVNFVTVFRDYRPVQGILFPFVIDQKTGDEENQITYLKKMDLNLPIADSVFAMSAMQSRGGAK